MRIFLVATCLFFFHSVPYAQHALKLEADNGSVLRFVDARNKQLILPVSLPLVSYELNKKFFTSEQRQVNGFKVLLKEDSDRNAYQLYFENSGTDTLTLSNVVPLGAHPSRIHITGKGDHGLSRTHLFIPGRLPVNVICPDNAWELGYAGIELNDTMRVCALTRRERSALSKGALRRFETVLYPGGSIVYRLFVESYTGAWQQGLERMFREKYLYDVTEFDHSLFERKDLLWIRHAYVMHLMMAWDRNVYDRKTKKYRLKDFVESNRQLYGGDDVIGIWPTWPSLGLDQRNQFDLFRDLPGGLPALKQLATALRRGGTKFFICYNPWDESTRKEGHLAGLGELIRGTGADGVVLDTRGASSKALQDAADRVKPGVVMYSEGMAVVKDMPGIVSGRVHNALYYPPMLNLNKFIMPEFAIFRVAELYKEKIKREFATSFFNGYGTELNVFAPGTPEWVKEQYQYLGRTSRILRENTFNFISRNYTPLIETTRDSIWVNRWKHDNKTIYTVYSVIPSGFHDYLFEELPQEGFHFVDLWHHREIIPKLINNKWMLPVETTAFNNEWLGTNNEGEVDCVARLPVLIEAKLDGDSLIVNSKSGKQLKLWKGDPGYDQTPVIVEAGTHKKKLSELFGNYEGKIVIQLFDNDVLMDETVLFIVPGKPRRISSPVRTVNSDKAIPAGMVKIPAGIFTFRESHGDAFIPYPLQDVDSTFSMPSMLMDKYPVTNEQFNLFLKASRYRPAAPENFLKHWPGGKMPAGQEHHPVVYVSYEDAEAYARWAGKRLPTEIEWQYAAQTAALNEWPWKQVTPVRRKEQVVTETLTVTALEGIDSSYANLGDGQSYSVGKYPAGANPFGLHDLTGSVWQLTNDIYRTGNYDYIILKGGSFFKPSSSWWYVQGGPRELHYRQFLLRVSPGFERNATVGFRCIKDVQP